MNIFLLPYTWPRHFAMALWCASAGLVAWWFALSWIVLIGPNWTPTWDGPILFCTVVMAISGANVLGEGNLDRLPLWKRVGRTLLAAAVSGAFAMVWYWLWHTLAVSILFSGDSEIDALDPSLVSLRYRIGAFAMTGVSTGIGPMIVRKGQGWVAHLVGGVAAGLAAAAAWYAMNSAYILDLYLSGAALGAAWGFTFGLLAWPIPDRLYAGWIRVLQGARAGRRIPVDALDGKARERFVGHYPRGLDLFMPREDGVMEMHVSVAVDEQQRYTARGLSLYPTLVRRLLERIDLRYDARRPAPLETALKSEDRVILGHGDTQCELEFVMLPKEEQ